MAKLVLGAFTDIEEVDQAIRELRAAGVPRQDVSLVPNTDDTMTIQVAGDAVLTGTVVGSLAGFALGILMVTSTFAAVPVALLTGFGWVVLSIVLCGMAGSIIGAFIGFETPDEVVQREGVLTVSGSTLLGVEDNQISESEIRDHFANHGADQVATVEHTTMAAKLIAAGPQ